ncbi:hypothetical protein [Streptomyces paradoxus]|uniref:hypothetical protein n=1 Tax=Streptomyces paradoxus TaxID=66375 RepID=UPI0037D2ED84
MASNSQQFTIPYYQDLLEAKGMELTVPDHVLLAHVVERETGAPFPTFIQQYGDRSVRPAPGEMVRWADAEPPDRFRPLGRLPDIWTK